MERQASLLVHERTPKMRLMPTRVHPKLITGQQASISSHLAQRALIRRVGRTHRQQRFRVSNLLHAVIDGCSWALVVILVTSQFTCIVWDTLSTTYYNNYGHDPRLGPYLINGENDEPYSDRSIVCVQQGRLYRPMQLNQALAAHKTRVIDTTGASISGYRTVDRDDIQLHDEIAQRYTIACSALAATLDSIIHSCKALGYNVVDRNDNLRIVNGIFSNTTHQIANSLPVLIMPYWDNAIFARYAMPAVDGDACVFRLGGQFDSKSVSEAWLSAVNRSVRTQKTKEWIGIPLSRPAMWRNGWMDDPVTAMRWYSDMISTRKAAEETYGIRHRQFDLVDDVEVDCEALGDPCQTIPIPEWWGTKFMCADRQLWYNSVAISNGTRFGLFTYEASQHRLVRSIYDIATLISNTTVTILLVQWAVAAAALLNAYRRGYSPRLVSAGIGCISCSRSFEFLPILLLPRLRAALAAFFTAGCKFEGEQLPFAESWFAIYPGIAETMLFYYSVLNLVAKATRRRMSDALFGPSLASVCLLHALRHRLALSGWFEFDGRIATMMAAKEFEALSVVDFIWTDAALRLNGNVWSIFSIKLMLLALNLVPLLLARPIGREPWPTDPAMNDAKNIGTLRIATVERAIGVRATESGGLGCSTQLDGMDPRTQYQLNCYELVRLGYIVLGDTLVISFGDWMLLCVFSILRSRNRPSNARVLAFVVATETVKDTDKKEIATAFTLKSIKPQMYHLHDAVLLDISPLDVAVLPLL